MFASAIPLVRIFSEGKPHRRLASLLSCDNSSSGVLSKVGCDAAENGPSKLENCIRDSGYSSVQRSTQPRIQFSSGRPSRGPGLSRSVSMPTLVNCAPRYEFTDSGSNSTCASRRSCSDLRLLGRFFRLAVFFRSVFFFG